MAKCPCQQAIWDIEVAWDEDIKYEEGDSPTSCKRVREIRQAEIKYGKECEWCPCRKRKGLDDEVFERENEHVNVSEVPPIDECVSGSTNGSRKYGALSEFDGARAIQGPCECNIIIARLAALLDKDYGSANPRKLDPALLPTDLELTQIYDAYSDARAKCTRCKPGARLDTHICSCRNAWERRQHLMYLIDNSVDEWTKYLQIYRNEFPEIELNWVHESKRCLACKERNKECLLEYRAQGICGRIWKTQLRFPNLA